LLLIVKQFTPSEAQAQYCSRSDAFGYCMRTDTSKTDPVTYNWIDTPNDAQQVSGMSDDNFFGPVPINFPFKYYWNTQTEVYIGSNGYLMFGKAVNVASSGTGFPEFPTSGGSGTANNFIGAFLTDLTFTDHKGVAIPESKIFYFNTDGGNKFVVTYEKAAFWNPVEEKPEGYDGEVTFQVILDKTDNSITINYKDVVGDVARTYRNNPNITYLSYGMENSNGEVGMQFEKNMIPKAGTAFKIFYPEKSTFKIKDLAPAWVFNDRNYGIIKQINDAPFNMTAAVRNVGTEDASNFSVRRIVYDYFNGNSTVDALTETVKVDALAVGETKEVEFTKPLNFTVAANYRVAVRVIYADDEVPTNQEISGEIMAKDYPNDEFAYTAGYDQFTASNDYSSAPNRTSDIVSRFEVGMYYSMPFYPCYVRGAVAGLWVLGNGPAEDTLLGYKMRLFDDSGVNGAPGKELDFVDVTGADIFALQDPEKKQDESDSYFIPVESKFSKEIKLEDGKGLYLSYKGNEPEDPQNPGHSDFLYVDKIEGGPISNRSFEITGGLWAPYRERNNSDFCLQLLISRKPTGREDVNLLLTEENLFPNPANDFTKVSFQLLNRSNVGITVINSLGQTVSTQDLGKLEAGVRSTTIDTQKFAPGIYTYTLNVDGKTISNKFVVNR